MTYGESKNGQLVLESFPDFKSSCCLSICQEPLAYRICSCFLVWELPPDLRVPQQWNVVRNPRRKARNWGAVVGFQWVKQVGSSSSYALSNAGSFSNIRQFESGALGKKNPSRMAHSKLITSEL